MILKITDTTDCLRASVVLRIDRADDRRRFERVHRRRRARRVNDTAAASTYKR